MEAQARAMRLVDRFAAIPYTGAISDVLDEMGHTGQVLPKEIRSLRAGQTLAGRALTIRGEVTASSDPEVIFVPFLKMLGDVRAGDVLVSQPCDDIAAHIGELSAETAKCRGARGAVIDGGSRDSEYLLKLDFPVFARYQTPRDIAGRWRLVEYNVPIEIGNIPIFPGDYVVGDRDGVVVIPQAIAEQVLTKTEEIVKTENLVRKEVMQGVHPLDAYRKHGRF